MSALPEPQEVFVKRMLLFPMFTAVGIAMAIAVSASMAQWLQNHRPKFQHLRPRRR
jgi:hypothetical protein